LRQLSEAGLVTSRREGYYVLYSLNPDRIEPLSDSLRRFLNE
jgi:DNA-binding transcriptional ArsR family regulator